MQAHMHRILMFGKINPSELKDCPLVKIYKLMITHTLNPGFNLPPNKSNIVSEMAVESRRITMPVFTFSLNTNQGQAMLLSLESTEFYIRREDYFLKVAKRP